jgi:hypothetical protein
MAIYAGRGRPLGAHTGLATGFEQLARAQHTVPEDRFARNLCRGVARLACGRDQWDEQEANDKRKRSCSLEHQTP